MDKNTMYGLLLMGAVILGFMWLNQPDPKPDSIAPAEQITAEQAEAMPMHSSLHRSTRSLRPKLRCWPPPFTSTELPTRCQAA